MSQLQDMLVRDEGMKLRAYLDTKGKITIGVGRNLEDVGISEAEAMQLLSNDIATARSEAAKYPFFPSLDPVRQDVMIAMLFNMGASRFAEFKRMFQALNRKDFEAAASEMLSSKWSSEVGKRAARLAEMMRSGVYDALYDSPEERLY